MKMRLHRIFFVVTLLVVETALQVVYLSCKAKFFEEFHRFDSLLEVLGKNAYYFGTVKLLLGAIGYGLMYLSVDSELDSSNLTLALLHAFVFFVLLLVLIFFFLAPSNGFVDMVALTLVAFFSSLVMLRVKRTWLFIKG
jgi:hypothetical protein